LDTHVPEKLNHAATEPLEDWQWSYGSLACLPWWNKAWERGQEGCL